MYYVRRKNIIFPFESAFFLLFIPSADLMLHRSIEQLFA